tara:strand:- start:67 stop:2475 length:2409 start_codon:yes stop_codon:yes gene_type:complete
MAQERIGYYGKLTPTSLDTSAADKMRALAGLGETVANTALAIGKPIAAQEGAKKGAIEGSKTGRVDPSTGELIAPPEQRKFGYGASAFNTAAESSYLGNVSFELDQSVKSAQEQFPDDIMGYNKLVDASKQGLLSKMPEQYRGSAELVFDKLNAKAASSVAKAENAKDLEILSAGIIKGANVASDLASNAAFAGDVVGLADLSTEVTLNIENLVKKGSMSQEAGDKFLESYEDRIAIQSKLGEVSRAVLDDAYPIEDRAVNGRAIVNALRDNPDQTLSAEQNQELLSKLDAQVTKFENKIKTDAATLSIEEQNEVADFKTQVKLNLGNTEELTAMAFDLQKRGLLSPDQRANFVIDINRRTDAEIKRQQSNANVGKTISGDSVIGGEPVDQSAVDNYYDDVVSQNLSKDNLDVRSAQQAEVVARTGYLAATNKTEIRNALNSQDPAQIEYAAETIERMGEIPGVGESLFTDNEVAFASQVTALSQYMPMEKAIEQATAIVRPGPVREAMVAERTAFIKDKKNSDVFSDAYPDEVKGAFEGLFDDISGELAKDLLVKDYGDLVESYYKAGIVDVDAAKAKAIRQVKANWTKGEFGLMKYSPESYYALPVTGDTSYIRTQLQEDLAAGGLDVDANEVILVSDDETARLASTNKPSYRAMYRDTDGTLRAVSFIDAEGNKNDRFIPDVAAGQIQQEENIKAVADAQKYRYGKPKRESYSTLNSNQQANLAKQLNQNAVFSLPGKGIGEATRIPEKITPSNMRMIVKNTGIEFAAGELADAYKFIKDSVQEASNNYVASLRKTKGK